MKQQATKKLGRNDPCHCGSGKKYKDCHLPIEEAFRSEQLRLRQAQDTLLPKIIEAAQTLPEQFPAAIERFWGGKHAIEQLSDLNDLEDRGAERFLTWFAFDMRHDDGRTLVEQLAVATDSGGFDADPFERRLLDAWSGVRLRAYVVLAVRKGKGVQVRDLLFDTLHEVIDSHAAKRLEIGEVIVGHLIPADTAPGAEIPSYYIAGASAQLTDDTAAKCVEFAELHLADLRRTQPEAGWAELLDQRSEILNHFVIALPTEQRDPTALDRIIAEGRLALQLTADSVKSLLGRGDPGAQGEAEEQG